MIPTQILRVLSTIRTYDVRALLMGGQACVLYGAAEYSRDLDLAVLATREALPALTAALDALHATVIAIPSFDAHYLDRGHAVHFSIPDGSTSPLRVDIMSRMRGVDAFPILWERRTTIALPDAEGDHEVLVDASYAAARDGQAPDGAVSDAGLTFWLAELRSPAFLEELIARYPAAAARCTRTVVRAALNGLDIDAALAAEQATIMAEDKAYWAPLRRELEQLRHEARKRE